ncbi:MAG TPA: hypothetical protein VFM09_01025 [Marmoricola sp.]|nr:hypothetical protein [Marmoricola sp.]
MTPFAPEGLPRRDHEAEERHALIERVRERFLVARTRSEAAGDERALRFGLREALTVSHDLYMLGCIDRAPTLRWRREDAEDALASWDVRVVDDHPALPQQLGYGHPC